jgi:recombination protein RecR
MPSIPEPIQNASAAFDSLPGVGPRASLRYAYWLVTQPKDVIKRFAKSLEQLADSVTTCQICHQWAETSPCSICRDSKRDESVICVVATSQDLRAIEETGVFKGRYHILGGTLDPIEGRTPDKLTLTHLFERLKSPAPQIRELILGLDADIPGDTTALYIRKHVENMPIKVTRLARGLPSGASLEYADAYTLADALVNRKEN